LKCACMIVTRDEKLQCLIMLEYPKQVEIVFDTDLVQTWKESPHFIGCACLQPKQQHHQVISRKVYQQEQQVYAKIQA